MKYILTLLFLVSSLTIFASSIELQLAQERTRLGGLIVGKGEADTEIEADQLALQDLSSQIVVTVKSSFEDRAKENNESVDVYCERIIKTYSAVELTEATKLSDKVDNKFIVYRYITHESKERIFKERKNLIYHHISEAERALEKENITDALRNYYWALILLKSHPQAQTLTYYFANQGKERLLQIALPNEMESILAKIKIELLNIKSDPGSNCSEVVLQATYRDKPVCGLLVSHYSGYSWELPTKWTNGDEVIQIKNTTLKNQSKLMLKIDYTFANHSFNGDILNTMSNIPQIVLLYSEKEVLLTQEIIETHKNQKEELLVIDETVSLVNTSVINEILSAIADKDIIKARKHFTAEGFQQFNKLMGYGNAVVMPTKSTIKQIKIAQNEIVKSIPMKFSFSSSKEDFTDNVNFIFDENGKVDGVTFALSDVACSDIIKKDFATPAEKQIIINFIEQYKTAYCLKDLDFIENVFSNDALIIVGKMVRSEPDKDNDQFYEQLNKEFVKYVKLSKADYVSRLAAQFKNKEFINVRFYDNSIDRVMSSSDKVFGIQIAQYYYSSNYRDQGYLFLMFDLRDINNPKIMVRSWQPKKSSDGTIVGMEDFQWE